jgi:hypothetical protein
MQGDYHRYLAEFKTGADRKEAAEHTLLAYKAAQVRSQLARTPGIARCCRGDWDVPLRRGRQILKWICLFGRSGFVNLDAVAACT